MTIDAKIILDSRTDEGVRIITWLLTYPRIIHAEFMTHREFSRNSSSSRAIPVLTMLRNTVSNLAAPSAWGSNKPGMQAGDELSPIRKMIAKALWYGCGYMAAGFSYLLAKVGAHKQIANRVLEPWTHITVVMTTTNMANFMHLRLHEDADPTIFELAQTMADAQGRSIPKPLPLGEWHLPFVLPSEQSLPHWDKVKLSAARCASASYNKVGSADLIGFATADRIWDKLIDSQPMHASPVEHQCTPDWRNEHSQWAHPHYHGNLRGVIQLRKTLANEAVFQ